MLCSRVIGDKNKSYKYFGPQWFFGEKLFSYILLSATQTVSLKEYDEVILAGFIDYNKPSYSLFDFLLVGYMNPTIIICWTWFIDWVYIWNQLFLLD